MELDELEESLLKQIREDSSSGFQRLYETYKDRIYRTCLRITGNVHDAEDATHETFLTIYEYIGKFRKEARLSTWIYQITISTALRVQNQRKRFLSPPSLQKISQPAKAPQPEDIFPMKEVVQKGLDRLPHNIRVCLVLHAMEGLSCQEISEILKIPTGTVKFRLFTARERMAEFFRSTQPK